MISIARILGAPVIEPPGKSARATVDRSGVGPQAPLDGGDQVVHLGEALNRERIGDADRPEAADPAQVVPLEVDDHRQLGAVLGAGGELLGQPRVLVDRAPLGAGSP